MVGKLQKWGNSLALRIPKAIADDLDLSENASVDMKLDNGTLVISSAQPKRYALNDLLASVTPENIHGEIDWGTELGAEKLS